MTWSGNNFKGTRTEIGMKRNREMIERERKEEEVLVDGENGKRQKNNAIRGGIY